MLAFLFLSSFLAHCKVFYLTDVPSTAKSPPLRAYHILSYIKKKNSLALFGGNLSVDKFYNDLWTFNLDDQKWEEVVSISSSVPSNNYTGGRISFGSFYDEYSNCLFIFGGNTPYGLQNDMWKFNFDTFQWAIVYPSNSPEPGYRFGYTSYSTNETTYFAIYGGKVFEGYSDHLHIYNSKENAWVEISNKTNNPPALILSCLQYYEGVIFLACGENPLAEDDADIYSTSTYSYDLSSETWTKLELSNDFDSRTYSPSVLIDDSMFIIYGYSGYDESDLANIQKLNLANPSKWETLSLTNDENIVRDSFSAVEVNKKIYLSSGYITKQATTLNDLVEINPENLSFKTISDNKNQPSSRLFHSMEIINGQLYIFGGFTDSGYTNELWKFDIESLYWEVVQVQGTNPVARCSHGSDSAGDIMVIWGGLSDNGNLGDMHYYNVFTNRWSEVVVEGDKPTPRRGACIEVNLPYVFLFGGRTTEGFSAEMWVYHAGKNEYKLYFDSRNQPVINQICDSEVVDGDVIFYSFTGASIGDSPVFNLRKFNLTSGKWNYLAEFSEGDKLDLTNPIGIRLGKDFLLMGGQKWMTDAYRNVFLAKFNDSDSTYNFISDSSNVLEDYIWGSAFAYYKNLIYSHGGGTQMGGSIRREVPTGKLYTLNITKYCEMLQNNCEASCSPGTYFDIKTNTCKICDKGKYSEGFGNTECKYCPAGTYNMHKGANSQEQCYPCPEGFFNNFEGQSLCLECPPGYSCPSGSKQASYSEFISQIKSSQPASYSENTQKAKDATRVFYFSFLSFCLMGIILIALFREKLLPVIKMIDIYTDGHNYPRSSILYLRKTVIGGIFTLIFILLAFLLIIVTIIEFRYSNWTETKSLIPVVIIFDEVNKFESDVSIKLNLMRYGGSCNESFFTDGSGLFNASVQGIQGNFQVIGADGDDIECRIEFFCKKCSLNVGASMLFTASEKSSYCSAITLNISADSSIKSEKSSLYFLIKTPENAIFRGPDPTIFKVSAIPSLFREGIDGKDKTGYHLSVNSEPEEGSYYSTQEIAFTANLNIKVEFDMSDASLFTLRYETETAIYMINALLGSVFGILSAVRVAMKLVEVSGMTVNDLRKKRKTRQKIINKRVNLEDQMIHGKQPFRVQTMCNSFFRTESFMSKI